MERELEMYRQLPPSSADQSSGLFSVGAVVRKLSENYNMLAVEVGLKWLFLGSLDIYL